MNAVWFCLSTLSSVSSLPFVFSCYPTEHQPNTFTDSTEKKWLRLDWSVASKIRSRLWRKRTSRNYFKQHVDTFDTSKVQRGLWKLWKIGIQDHPKFAQGLLKNLTFSDSRSKLHLLVLRIELCIYMEVQSLKIKSRTLETHLHSNGHCLF